ncbi:nitrate/nitrite transporter [Bradyrhizobium sp. CCBAU 53338]|uniref:MFS transporter n=1 Tax=Bradyrhizobium sp. CCBAU 53338 TaxID=1325111 RepID=UPI00188A815B|nr:MFS transporter [Bradyrhizobium sp. CCBAU 53338]QOZ52549.1 MFS transporter [Bradyrhizobium sp. CCBAU 53338]
MNLNMLAEKDQARIWRWQIAILALALIGEVFLAADWYAFAAVISFVSETLQLDHAQAGFAQGIFALAYALGMVAWSPASARMSARNMLLIGLVGTGVGMVLQTFVQSYAQLIGLRLFIGLFDAAIFLGNMKLIFGWFPQSRRASIVGLVLAAYSLAITLDFAVGVPLTLAVGWRAFFGTLAAGTLVMGLVNWLLVRNGPAEIGYSGFAWEEADGIASRVPFRLIFAQKWFFVSALGICSGVGAIAGTATWVVPAYIKVQNMPVESAALIGVAMGLSQVVFLTVGGYISDHVRKSVMIRIGALLALVSALLFTVSTIYPMSFILLLVFAGLSGMCVIGGGAIFSLLSEKYPPSIATAAVGYAEIFGMGANFLSPWIMGVVLTETGGSFTHGFLAFAALEAIFVVALLVLALEPRAAKSIIDVRNRVPAN